MEVLEELDRAINSFRRRKQTEEVIGKLQFLEETRAAWEASEILLGDVEVALSTVGF